MESLLRTLTLVDTQSPSMEASRDQNFVPTVLATSDADGSSTVPVQVDSVTSSLRVNLGTTAPGVTVSAVAKRDGNHVPVLMGVSASDGVTPTPILSDPQGALYITSS